MSDDRFWAEALAEAEAADSVDPLRAFRDRFRLPVGVIYLDGNSLGLAPEAALSTLVLAAEEEWARDLITSWNKAGWFDLATRYGDIVGEIVGAAPGQIVRLRHHVDQYLQGTACLSRIETGSISDRG